MEKILLRDMIKAIDGKLLTHKDINESYITDVTINSRKIKERSLFVPIAGEHVDGHDFISVAFENGAVCALTEKEEIEINEAYHIVYVKNTVKALGDLARFYCSCCGFINTIEITGSVGKTTTKDMLASVMSQKFVTFKTEGNYNNEIGLPFTLFGIKKETQVAVLELGMSRLGEIKYLTSIPPKSAAVVITNIGSSHIENLGSREGILKAKTEIFDNLNEDGIAFLNSDDDMLLTLKDNPNLANKIWWFGIENKIHTYADNIELMGLNGTNCDIHLGNIENEILSVHIPSPGRHMVYAVLAAVAIAKYFEISLEEIKTGIENFIPTEMRMNILKSEKLTIINDAYNASLQSMKSALDVLKTSGDTRKVAILGDMFEMGDYAEAMHKEVGRYAVSTQIDLIICVGEFSLYTYEAANRNKNPTQTVLYFKNQESLHAELSGILNLQDTILVKASRGMYLEKTIDKIKEVKL